MLAIADGELDATLVDANIFKINSQFYPGLKTGFTLADQQHQAWAFLPGDDDSLVQKARSFFNLIKENGSLAAIQDRYNENGNDLDRVGMFQFMKQVRNRLPPLITGIPGGGAGTRPGLAPAGGDGLPGVSLGPRRRLR